MHKKSRRLSSSALNNLVTFNDKEVEKTTAFTFGTFLKWIIVIAHFFAVDHPTETIPEINFFICNSTPKILIF